MKLLKSENVKFFLLLGGITLLVTLMVRQVVFQVYIIKEKEEINKNIAAIVGICIQKYPNAEEEIIQTLKQIKKEDVKIGEELLKRYGIEAKEVGVSSNIEEVFKQREQIDTFCILFFEIFLMLSFLIYLAFRNKKIKQISQYLQKVQKGNYSLEIADNQEGELSKLKNEIYKITVMLKEQAENLKNEKGYLADSLSDISHQIKTPITSISVMIDILQEDKNLTPEKRQEFLREVNRQIEWIKWLVVSLLKLSKLDAGAVEFKKETINGQKLLEVVIQNLNIPIDIKNQTVTLKAEKTIEWIGDFKWYAEAITNVLKNCIEHTKEGGKILIEQEDNILFSQIKITDEGEGIAKEDLPYVFKRFYKGKNASKDSVGIGLALAKTIIEKQGGDISVKSEIGKGSVFTIKMYK